MDTKFPAQQDELVSIWRQLQRQWESTKTVWSDQHRRDFEENVWYPLANDVQRLIDQLQASGVLMRQAERELPKPPRGARW